MIRVFLPSFEKERRKMLAKRRKKARGSTERLTAPPSRNTLRVLGEWVHRLPQRSGEGFGLFPSGKALTASARKLRGATQTYVRTN